MHNYIAGQWTRVGSDRNAGGAQPRDRRGARPHAAVAGRGSRSGRPGGGPRVSGLAARAGHRAGAVPVQAEDAARENSSRTWRAPSPWRPARRSPNRAARCGGRSRTSRSRAARPMLIQGYNSEDIAGGHRRDDDPPAARRLRDHRAVQLPRDDPVLVPAVRDRLRQHRRRQAVRARAADDAEGVRAARRPEAAAGRREPGERRPRGGRRHPRPSGDPRGQLRRLEHRGAARLLARRRGRQARAVPGRREESGRRPARRRHGVGVRDHRGQRVRLRRPALPRVVVRDRRRRAARAVHRGDPANGRRAA